MNCWTGSSSSQDGSIEGAISSDLYRTKKIAEFLNITLDQLKIRLITLSRSEDQENTLGQACFYSVLELQSLICIRHAVTFCGFLGLIDAKNMKLIVFNCQNSEQCYPESIEPSFASFGPVFQKLFPKNGFCTDFKKGSILEWFTQRKKPLIPQRILLSLYSLTFHRSHPVEILKRS